MILARVAVWSHGGGGEKELHLSVQAVVSPLTLEAKYVSAGRVPRTGPVPGCLGGGGLSYYLPLG